MECCRAASRSAYWCAPPQYAHEPRDPSLPSHPRARPSPEVDRAPNPICRRSHHRRRSDASIAVRRAHPTRTEPAVGRARCSAPGNTILMHSPVGVTTVVEAMRVSPCDVLIRRGPSRRWAARDARRRPTPSDALTHIGAPHLEWVLEATMFFPPQLSQPEQSRRSPVAVDARHPTQAPSG
jgi:hypothetical protein